MTLKTIKTVVNDMDVFAEKKEIKCPPAPKRGHIQVYDSDADTWHFRAKRPCFGGEN